MPSSSPLVDGTTTATSSASKRRDGAVSSRRKKKKKSPSSIIVGPTDASSLASTVPFKLLVGLLIVALGLQFALVAKHKSISSSSPYFFSRHPGRRGGGGGRGKEDDGGGAAESSSNLRAAAAAAPPPPRTRRDSEAAAAAENVDDGPPHLHPRLPHLPPFPTVPNADSLADETLSGARPTVAGIASVLTRFVSAQHESNRRLSKDADLKRRMDDLRDALRKQFVEHAKEHLLPLDASYRGKSIFPIREDDSVYLSLASFREHLLAETLRGAFGKAKHPDKLYVGAVIQNCFGVEYTCKTGAQVVGKDAHGRDMTKVSDAPPDKNGVEEFCDDPVYKRYCDSGQIRALYVNETESLGPAMARYYASKLWGGETYFVQVDSHLQFAPDWDARYVAEAKAAKSYPKAILSSYPPGFGNFGDGGTAGTRLCTCTFSTNDVEQHIVRINTGGTCRLNDPRPTQIAFIAAGFFFARSEFLVDVPFDPMLPWCFMGEEIALSMRAWTSGWDVYAPRQNLIAHQYRPGRMGLPKFWGSVGRLFGRPQLNTKIQAKNVQRVKHMVGYPKVTREALIADDNEYALLELEHYGLGTVRTREEYLKLTNIDMEKEVCNPMPWCNKGELE